MTRLKTAFGEQDLKASNKAIKVKANGFRRNSDVVVCYQYRYYIRFISTRDYEYIPGIIFPTASSGDIINFPKMHSENCTGKHQATSSGFKPMIRIMKNVRSRLVHDGVIAKDTAPSYYIEGLLYNVPDDKFGDTYSDTFCNCVGWLLGTDRTKLVCAHRQYRLLGNSNVQWSSGKCDQFLNAVVVLWKNWQ